MKRKEAAEKIDGKLKQNSKKGMKRGRQRKRSDGKARESQRGKRKREV